MTNPEAVAGLRDIKVPAGMNATQALKEFLVSQAGIDQSSVPLQQQLNANQQLLVLLIGSHLEVVNTLGALEEGLMKLAQRPI